MDGEVVMGIEDREVDGEGGSGIGEILLQMMMIGVDSEIGDMKRRIFKNKVIWRRKEDKGGDLYFIWI